MRLGKRTERLVREYVINDGDEYPRESKVQEWVFSTARSFNDLYPLLSKVDARSEAERDGGQA